MPDFLEMGRFATFRSQASCGPFAPNGRSQTQNTLTPSVYNTIRPLLDSPTFINSNEKPAIELYDAIPQESPHVFQDSDEFEEHLSSTPKPETRIMYAFAFFKVQAGHL
jgi:hypothetical protein